MCSGAIKFSIKKTDDISLKIYDSHENFVNEILHGNLDEGNYRIVWNGKDRVGRDVTKGVYYFQLNGKSNLNMMGPIFVK